MKVVSATNFPRYADLLSGSIPKARFFFYCSATTPVAFFISFNSHNRKDVHLKASEGTQPYLFRLDRKT